MTMRTISALLYISLAMAACKAPQEAAAPATSNADGTEAQAAAPEEEAPAPQAEAPLFIGTWKVTGISDLRLPDPELNAMADDIKAKILADLRIELNADSTYAITGFDGQNIGRWEFDGKRKLRQLRDDGMVDTITFSAMTPDEMKGTMGTAEGLTCGFTFARVR